MEPVIVEHDELKLIGIPCISLKDMKNKFVLAKESLLSSTKHFPQVVNHNIHYGIWPMEESQNNPETHAYILCVEVSTFEQIPEWFVKITLPKQRNVVVANEEGNFDAAGEVILSYIQDHHIKLSSDNLTYRICEKYNYDAEGFSRYSLPIASHSIV
ncbi:effector binding domain-containing protein [Bacillus horti]|uniref:Transcriptional regulator YdeE n=1 Tax=Caldalkalibacillus horti TaxID=77523 RepID=A0ABT9W3J2_9BACI|nr:effector binding domain-containing protein [Bacillus horti]MDQ0167813.1 putative transcriptional regulator YdeE [Bacillus horti]